MSKLGNPKKSGKKVAEEYDGKDRGKILVLLSDDDLTSMIERYLLLDSNEYQVVSPQVTSGLVELCVQYRPIIIITHIQDYGIYVQMPFHQFIQEMRNKPETNDISFLLINSSSDIHLTLRCDDVIIEWPFDIEDLKNQLEKIVRRRFTKFGENLRILRREYGVTVKQLAEILDVEPTYLTRIEHGQERPWENLEQQVCKFFGRNIAH